MKTTKEENNASRNLTMLVDYYELTMANGYLANGLENTVAYFDMFFRSTPDAGGYAIMAGVEPLIEYLEGLKFTARDIDFLREKGFDNAFLRYLENFEFACDVWAVPEGTPIFVLPLVAAIEFLSFLSRPFTLAIRLFANMTAGHVLLKVFGGFVVALGSFEALPYVLGIIPLTVNVALTALELLIAVVQAYVFALLASIYLNDAVNLH